MAVAFDVAVLAADDEEHQILGVARVRDAARRRRLDVDQAAGTENTLLAVDLEEGLRRTTDYLISGKEQ